MNEPTVEDIAAQALGKAMDAVAQTSGRLNLAVLAMDKGELEEASVELSFVINEAVRAVGALGYVIGSAQARMIIKGGN